MGRQATVSAQGSDGAGGAVQRDIKVASNSFNLGKYYTWGGDKFMWGYSFDVGVRFRGYTRKAEPSKISDEKWEKIFNVGSDPFRVLYNVIPSAYTI
ncbi:MAG: hypothetical protein SGJ10_13550 [Bacteroidota bacterium]|nr:hypothetical protein [Bacteroidota bacterium]